jgi:hypothetical protein
MGALGGKEHAWSRLAAITRDAERTKARDGMMRTIVRGQQCDTASLELCMDPTSVFEECAFVIKAPSDPRLVCHHDQDISSVPCGTAQLEYAWHPFSPFARVDIAVVDIDDTVAIKEQRLARRWETPQ